MSRDQNRSSSVSRRFVLGGAGALAATGIGLAGLSGCEDRSAPVDEQGRVRLRFATDAPAGAQHGGFYQALASGAYERRDLNVEIIQGGPAVDVPQLLASGAVELGIGSNSFIPLNLVRDGAPVKAVAAFFQKDPQALIAHPDAALEGIADLAGRPFQLPEIARTTWWPWLKAKYGFEDDQLRNYSPDPVAFFADRRAVRQGDVANDPFTLGREGRFRPKTFLLADEGYPSYGALVLAPNGFARDNAAALRAFIAASVEGWRDYMNSDPSAANALIGRANTDAREEDLLQARDAMNANSLVEGGDAALYGLGAMTTERWQAFFEAVSSTGVYPTGLNWRDAFTNAYLPGRG